MKNQKTRTVVAVVLLAIIAICLYGIFSPSDNADEKEQVVAEKTEGETTQNAEPEESEASSENSEQKDGTYDLDGVSVIFEDSVRNDTTGNWRLAKVTGNEQVENYALKYYEEFFESDSEIHAVVNFTLDTTSRITVMNGKIFVAVFEHEDGEEHDAKLLFGGEKLAEYEVDIQSGNISTVE